MIGSVHIQNFKSIRDLTLEPKRVNVFIGEPNSGKSNLLEALAFFSPGVYDTKVFKEIFRFRKTPDLFYDREISRPVAISIDALTFSLCFAPPKSFEAEISHRKKVVRKIQLTNTSLNPYQEVKEPDFGVAYYRFKTLLRFSEQVLGTFYPPFGSNLVAVVSSNQRLRRGVSDLLRSKGFRLQLDPLESEIAIAKDIDDQLFKYPYESFSETLRRIVFFMAVLETNRNTALLLDEPETNTFPFYTSYLAERIALDESNQFFLTTHNPYILGSIVGKTPMKDLAVFVTTMENFATKLKPVTNEGLSRILDYGPDAFLNLDKLVA